MTTLTYGDASIEVLTVEAWGQSAVYGKDGVTHIGTRHTIVVVSPPGPDAPVVVGPEAA